MASVTAGTEMTTRGTAGAVAAGADGSISPVRSAALDSAALASLVVPGSPVLKRRTSDRGRGCDTAGHAACADRGRGAETSGRLPWRCCPSSL